MLVIIIMAHFTGKEIKSSQQRFAWRHGIACLDIRFLEPGSQQLNLAQTSDVVPGEALGIFNSFQFALCSSHTSMVGPQISLDRRQQESKVWVSCCSVTVRRYLNLIHLKGGKVHFSWRFQMFQSVIV